MRERRRIHERTLYNLSPLRRKQRSPIQEALGRLNELQQRAEWVGLGLVTINWDGNYQRPGGLWKEVLSLFQGQFEVLPSNDNGGMRKFRKAAGLEAKTKYCTSWSLYCLCLGTKRGSDVLFWPLFYSFWGKGMEQEVTIASRSHKSACHMAGYHGESTPRCWSHSRYKEDEPKILIWNTLVQTERWLTVTQRHMAWAR